MGLVGEWGGVSLREEIDTMELQGNAESETPTFQYVIVDADWIYIHWIYDSRSKLS